MKLLTQAIQNAKTKYELITLRLLLKTSERIDLPKKLRDLAKLSQFKNFKKRCLKLAEKIEVENSRFKKTSDE